jgi:hypothetical protein
MIRIVQYIQPWEIDDFERQINQLIKSSYDIENPKDIIIDVTLNLEIVDWDSSKMPKEYFIDKFTAVCKRAQTRYSVEYDMDVNIQGVTDKRRSIESKEQDYIIWLDSDVFFPATLLPYMVLATKNIDSEYFILSPQLIRYWDASWDVLTNKKYLSEPFNHRDYFESFGLDAECSNNETMLTSNLDRIKFGGGWFNLFSNSVFKKIPIPKEIGAYGPDDTYISECSNRSHVMQYILSGQVVTEVGKLYQTDYIKSLLNVKIQDKQKITDSQLGELIYSFILKNQKN